MRELFETFEAVDIIRTLLQQMVTSIITVLLLPQQKTSVGSLHTGIIKRIVLNIGLYIDSHRNEADVGISLRLGLVSFTKAPQNIWFAFCYCYIRRPTIFRMILWV